MFYIGFIVDHVKKSQTHFKPIFVDKGDNFEEVDQ